MQSIPEAPEGRDGLESVATRIETLEQQNAVLRDLVSIAAQLSAMVLRGARIEALTEELARLVGRDVFVLDPALNALAQATRSGSIDSETSTHWWSDERSQLPQALIMVAEEQRPIRVPRGQEWELGGSAVIAPIGVGREILGYLAIVDPGQGSDADLDLDLLTIEHAAMVYALAFTRERMAAELANRFKSDLIDALLDGRVGDATHAREWSRLLAYDPLREENHPPSSWRVLLVTPEGLAVAPGQRSEDTPATLGLRHHLLQSLLDAVAVLAPRAVGVARGGELVVIVPENPGAGHATSLGLARDLERHLSRLLPTARVTIGVSGAGSEAGDLPRAFAQAREACQIGRLLQHEGSVVEFERLGVYCLLLQAADTAGLIGYAEEVLGPLLAYDRKHQSDLVRTLRAYLARNASPQAAARELFLHVNTVAYRIQRIERIAGLDLASADDRLAAQLALKILDGLQPEVSSQRT